MQIKLQIITFIYFTKIIAQAAQILVGLVHKASLFVFYIIGLFDKTNGALFLLVTFLCSNIKGTTNFNFNFNFQTVMSDAVFA